MSLKNLASANKFVIKKLYYTDQIWRKGIVSRLFRNFCSESHLVLIFEISLVSHRVS